MTKLRFLLFTILALGYCLAQSPNKDDILRMLQQSIQAAQQPMGEQDEKFQRAKTLEKAGLWEEAEQLYREINTNSPGNTRYLSPLKAMLLQRREWGDLIHFLNLYLDEKPNDLGILLDLGSAYIDADSTQQWQFLFSDLATEYNVDEGSSRRIISILMSKAKVAEAEKILADFRQKNMQPEYFAFDMANLYISRMVYDKAMDEYLLYLEYTPEKVESVSERILVLSDDPVVQGTIRNKLLKSRLTQAGEILADLDFKNKSYLQAFNTLKASKASAEKMMEFGSDLITMQEYDLADSVFHTVLSSEASEAILQETIFRLAQLFEVRTIQSMYILPISGFYRGNPFFSSPFLRVDEESAASLWEAVSLYDSLRISSGSDAAGFRLGEIRYLVLNDLDGARMNYEEVIQMQMNSQFKFPSKVRLTDLLISKGDLVTAEKNVRRQISNPSRNDDLFTLKHKLGQILMYSDQKDSLDALLGDLLKKMSPSDDHYNDILEVTGLSMQFNENRELFSIFSAAQLALQQNKRTEALKQLEPLMAAEDEKLSQLASYQAAHLLLLQGETEQVEVMAAGIQGESLYAELALIMQAEIRDYIYQDVSVAIDIYLNFLERFPLSIYYDDIRMRLRELAS